MDRIKDIKNKIIKIFKKQQVNSEIESCFLHKRDFHYKKQLIDIHIENNIDELLLKSVLYFKNKKLSIKIGIEVEFFNEVKKDFVVDFCNLNNIKIIDIVKEREENQFEIVFQPYKNIKKLIKDYNNIKNYLIKEFRCDFNSVFNNKKVGNALQINISIFDKKNNLFNIKDSNLLNNSIAGLLYTTNMFLDFYSKNIYRYDKNNNLELYSSGKIPAPSFISWGYNNRTCAIRIPDSKVILNDIKKYKEELEKTKRIEFRVPSSDSDIKFIIYCILNSIAYGIESNLKPIEPTYNNVYKDNEGLIEISNKYYYDFNNYYEVLKSLL